VPSSAQCGGLDDAARTARRVLPGHLSHLLDTPREYATRRPVDSRREPRGSMNEDVLVGPASTASSRARQVSGVSRAESSSVVLRFETAPRPLDDDSHWPDHQVRCSPGVSRLWLFQRRARRSFRISARARTTGTPLRRAQPRAPDGAAASRSGRADPSSSFATGELFPVFN